jgi:hypothetical protein
MSIDLIPGILIPIPCRACGRGMIPFTLEWGSYRLTCSACGGSTLVQVSDEGGKPRIRTEAAADPAPGSSS